jgi:hypothetical protein
MMRRQFILRDPDPTGAAGGGDPAPDPKPKKKDDGQPPTAADTGAGGKTAKEVALEKKVATLEDDQHTLKKQLDEATAWIKKQVETTPAPAKSDVIEEMNEFLGWGT